MGSGASSKIRLGVLAPGSNFVPFLAGDMLDAFEFGLAEGRLDAEIIVESAGYNADLKMVLPAVQQLILARRVKCIVAPLNVSLIEKIAGYCENQAVPLIALNLTEDPLTENAQTPFVFVDSFHLWHCAWMSGYLAAQRFGGRAVGFTALHEGGYGLMFAFQLGLEAAQGSLMQVMVTHRNSSIEDPAEDIARAVEQKPDFICASYSGKEAVSFLKSYETSELKGNVPLITFSPMMPRQFTDSGGNAAREIWSVTAERNDKDAGTLTALTGHLGREPNPYALLAYESARLIAESAGETKNTEDFTGALRRAGFKGPRGLARFDDYKEIDLTFFLRRISDAGDEVVERFETPPLLNEQYLLACKKLAKQGWINPYLCA